VLERFADDPPCEDCVGFNVEESTLAEPSPPAPERIAGKLAAGGAAEVAGAGDADGADTAAGIEDNESMESAAMDDRPT